jgi:hypothetical protein
MLPQNIIYIAVVIQLIGAFSYIKGMWKGTTRPNRVSWTIWALAPLIGAWLSWKAGAGLSVLPVFMSGFNPVLVLISSFIIKKGYWKITKFDIVCGALAVCALVLWMITRNFAISIMFAILSDGLAAIPTLVKSWRFPETESAGAYIGGVLANIIGLLIIRTWSFPIYSLGIYFVLINLMLVFCIYRKKFYVR